MAGVRPRAATARLVAAAAPFALLVTGCSVYVTGYTPGSGAETLAVSDLRRRNAAAGAALTLLAVLAVRHLLLRYRRPRWQPPHPVRLPALLLTAAIATELTALLLLALVGAGVGYVFGPVPGEAAEVLAIGGVVLINPFLLTLVTVPVALAALTAALVMLRVPPRLPWVPTSTFVKTALGHAVFLCIGASMALRPTDGVGAWEVSGALLAAMGALGVLGYAAGVGARRS